MFIPAEDGEVGFQEQRRIDPTLTRSTSGDYRIESANHDVACCLVFGEVDRADVADATLAVAASAEETSSRPTLLASRREGSARILFDVDRVGRTSLVSGRLASW